jgi:PAS domain S-box-containing protein
MRPAHLPYHPKPLAYVAGLLLLGSVFFIEFYFSPQLITVAYLILTPLLLVVSTSPKRALFIGFFTSILLILAYFSTMGYTTHSPVSTLNRVLALPAVWVMVFLSIWIRRLQTQQYFAQKNLQAIFDNASEGILLLDEQGKIKMLNNYALAMVGYSADELVNQEVEKLIPMRFKNIHRKHRQRFASQPATRPMGQGLRLSAACKNGLEIPVEIGLGHYFQDGRLHVIAFVTDISEKEKRMEQIRTLYAELEKRIEERTHSLTEAYQSLEQSNRELHQEIANRQMAEAKLLATQKRYDAMARNYPSGIIAVLDNQLRFVLVDGAELEHRGWSPEKLLGKRILDHPNTLIPAHLETHLKAAFTGNLISVEYPLGDDFFHLIGVPLADNHTIPEVLLVLTNITDSKKTEHDLKRNLQKEKELGELKSRFVATASHEFRTPLSTIMSSIFLLENYQGEQFEREKGVHISRIKRSVTSLLDILNEFLSLEKLREGKVEVAMSYLDISVLIEELVQEMKLQLKKDQEIRYQHEGESLLISDKKILRSILLNLLSNALKYSKPEGKVEIHSSTTGGALFIAVADEGIGIPQADQPYIFKRFYRAHNASFVQGTGLGLNIVKKYLHLLKGIITFRSEENVGSTFEITLPLPHEEEVFITTF